MVVVRQANDSAFVRYICDQCLWHLDVLRFAEQSPHRDFEVHNCKDYRRRNYLT